ncbi:tripartite tricarboxylate transporter TctB family protein [Chachezhania sediminis]|uniref:tripartite tricarboxylate transporter TctB family protein n=1 Tax=Chachezhania sediminis TaxID=2599291 RepID=UPI00131AEB11|nr:tripartite tricarboxylate transporter TctB family protein [Chachezhania sediminis]
MKRADLVSGLVLAAFGVVMLAVVIPAQIEPAPDGYVSPRLVPNLAMIVIVALSLLLVLQSLPKSEETPKAGTPVFFARDWVALAKISGVFAASLVLFWLGSPLAAGAVLIAGTLLLLGERRPVILVGMPAGLLLAVWALFYKLLGTVIL